MEKKPPFERERNQSPLQCWNIHCVSKLLHSEFWIYRVAQKVSHCQESSSNRIKNRQCGYISHQFWW